MNQITETALGDPETHTRIQQFEMAYRMQSSAPELMDLQGESKATLELYGIKDARETTFARNCLLARRLVERGTRFVQIYHWGWDSHGTDPSTALDIGLINKCRQVDKAITALILDLKQRGLLDDTLVVWGGEFGRTVYSQGALSKDNHGRDHHGRCFSIWMAGGGVKPGITIGQTDDLGYRISENPFEIRDLQATIMHLIGLDAHV